MLLDERIIDNYLVQMEADEDGDIHVKLSKSDNGWSYETLMNTWRTDRQTAEEDFRQFVEIAERKAGKK